MGLGVNAVSVGARLHLNASSPSRPRGFQHVCGKSRKLLQQTEMLRTDPTAAQALREAMSSGASVHAAGSA